MKLYVQAKSKKAINEKGLESQKVQYFTFLVNYFINEKEVMDVAKSYQTIFETYSKADDARNCFSDSYSLIHCLRNPNPSER